MSADRKLDMLNDVRVRVVGIALRGVARRLDRFRVPLLREVDLGQVHAHHGTVAQRDRPLVRFLRARQDAHILGRVLRQSLPLAVR